MKKRYYINIKEAKLILKKNTELKSDETKIKMTKKENINFHSISIKTKKFLKDKKNIIESKMKNYKS